VIASSRTTRLMPKPASKPRMKKRIIVIGGGIVGLATARAILRKSPDADVTVLEKEPNFGSHQSTHNSGVLHCGLYYKPGSLKAHLAVGGLRRMTEFCQRHTIPHEICGKVVVATDDAEVGRLRDLHQNGLANGLEGLQWLNGEELREIEPHVAGVAGLKVPQEGIVDYQAVVDALTSELSAAGANCVKKAEVKQITHRSGQWLLATPSGAFEADYLVNCAGLFCDKVAELAGIPRKVRIVPFRGEYFKLTPEGERLVRHLIYPVPDPEFPFLGVHFTRLIHGGIEAGPNAVLAWAREGYKKTNINLFDMADAIGFPGLWRFMRKYPKMVTEEVIRSFSKELFTRSLQKLVPAVRKEHLTTGGAGVRAQAMLEDGTLVQDFQLVESANALHVLNAPSPAATASLAIGEHLAEKVQIAA
jgi:L-2-hydroxyglutarate oxidase